MKYVFITLSLLFIQISFSQVDYNKIKDQYIHVCGHIDSVVLYNNFAFVDSLALLKIGDGFEEFLNDYGMAYYQKYLYTKSRNDIVISTNAYSRCWEQFNSINALYSFIFNYATFDCTMSRKYIPVLEKILRKDKSMSKEVKEGYLSQIKIVKEFVCKE